MWINPSHAHEPPTEDDGSTVTLMERLRPMLVGFEEKRELNADDHRQDHEIEKKKE